MSPQSCRVTIFEGCDGSGKSTAAEQFADQTNAKLVHFGPLQRVESGLNRIYVEAMLPALLGYQDVVFDRSWLSEPPYGTVFREGADRVGVAGQRMLERLAMRCGARVVRCRPPWGAVERVYRARKQNEVLNGKSVGVELLRQVYHAYDEVQTSLPIKVYDWTSGGSIGTVMNSFADGMAHHDLSEHTAGNLTAPYLLVGQDFAPHKNQDPFYQWPFASFSGEGCSQWLTEQLEKFGIRENQLCWINADMDFEVLQGLHKYKKIIALGDVAANRLRQLEAAGELAAEQVHFCEHPQYWKRFRGREAFKSLLQGFQR